MRRQRKPSEWRTIEVTNEYDQAVGDTLSGTAGFSPWASGDWKVKPQSITLINPNYGQARRPQPDSRYRVQREVPRKFAGPRISFRILATGFFLGLSLFFAVLIAFLVLG